jgi:PAS domain S-box-containing protein
MSSHIKINIRPMEIPMSSPDIDQEKARQKKELRLNRQVAFASGIFQDDVTIRTILASLAEGLVIIDDSGTILLVNTAAEIMFGYQMEDLVGKPHYLLLPERLRKIHEEHQAHFFADPRFRGMDQVSDLVGLRRDGSEFPLGISLGFIKTLNGVFALALVSDFTLRRQAESSLRESEELFHLQIERVKNYAIFTLDTRGNVLNWNSGAERLKGYRAEEIIGKHFSCFYSEEDRNAGRPEEELKKAVAEGQVVDEGWRVCKDGSRFWADVIITSLHDESGNLLGFSKVTRNITERKRVAEEIERLNTDLTKKADELQAANKELEAFNHTIAHDLRQPLNLLGMCCQSLKLLCCDQLSDECMEYVQDAHKATLRMDRLIGVLLNFSQMGRVEPRREMVDLGMLVHEVSRSLQLSEPERQVDFRIADGVVANGDVNLLRSVFDNLLSNALKYTSMREKAIIEFGVSEINGVPTYFVRDNGGGFDQSDADKLFTPFTRLPGAEEYRGIGIGLATVERIIRRHGGKVWAEGEPDKGACFYFTLPVSPVS